MVAVPIIVGISRMYRGVHYLTDVIGGITLGAACVLTVYLIAPPAGPQHRRAGRAANVPDPRPDDR